MPTRPHQRPDPHRDVYRDPSRAVQWVGYHLGELFGIAAPAALAVTVSWWFALLAVLVTAGWITHELRLHRHRQALTTTHPQAITSRGDHAADAANHGADESGEVTARDKTGRRASR